MITVIVQYDQLAAFRAGLNPTHPCVGIDIDPSGLSFEVRNLIADRLHATHDERSHSLEYYLCSGLLQDGVTKPQVRQDGEATEPVFLPVLLPSQEYLLEAVQADAAKLRPGSENAGAATGKPVPMRFIDESANPEEGEAAPDHLSTPPPLPPRLAALPRAEANSRFGT